MSAAFKNRKGPNTSRWKGGRSNWHGYVRVLAPSHPAAWADGYIAEHRLIAEKVLGRYLKPTEAIHHVNGIKNDNRNENLVICQDNAYHKLLHKRQRQMELF
jgi:hypothetical protein